MNRPVGIIGPIQNARQIIRSKLNENDQILELEHGASMQEIKDFRKFLLSQGLSRKVGIINLFNRFSDAQQAVLLKIFEELPSFNKTFFTASFVPNFTIETRSEIIHIPTTENITLKKHITILLDAMKNEQLSEKLQNAWKVLIHTTSLFNDGIINEKEKNTILKGIGIDDEI